MKRLANNSPAGASEAFAFAYLGAMGHVASMLVGEDELFRRHVGVKVPEAVFATPSPAPRRVSVEVKRIVSLSHADGTRPSHGGFCWLSTIRSAVDKAHADLVCSYGLTDHHVVLCTHSGIRRRVERHARRILDAYVGSGASACAARRVHLHVVATPACMLEGNRVE